MPVRAGDRGWGRHAHRKDVGLERHQGARACGAAEKLGRRDERPQHRAGGSDPPQHVEPGGGGAGVVGELHDGRMVVVHRVADSFRKGKDRLGAAGVQRGACDAVDACAAGAFPPDPAAAGVGQRGPVEQGPYDAGESKAGEDLRQDRRRAARLLGIGDGCRPDALLPGGKPSFERADDLLGRALVEGARIVAAARRGERGGSAPLLHAGACRRIGRSELLDRVAGGDQCHGHGRPQFSVERAAERRWCQQHDVEQPDIHRVVVGPRGLQEPIAFFQCFAGAVIVAADRRPGRSHRRFGEAAVGQSSGGPHPLRQQFCEQRGQAESLECLRHGLARQRLRTWTIV